MSATGFGLAPLVWAFSTTELPHLCDLHVQCSAQTPLAALRAHHPTPFLNPQERSCQFTAPCRPRPSRGPFRRSCRPPSGTSPNTCPAVYVSSGTSRNTCPAVYVSSGTSPNTCLAVYVSSKYANPRTALFTTTACGANWLRGLLCPWDNTLAQFAVPAYKQLSRTPWRSRRHPRHPNKPGHHQFPTLPHQKNLHETHNTLRNNDGCLHCHGGQSQIYQELSNRHRVCACTQSCF